jgi:hypothetical protein
MWLCTVPNGISIFDICFWNGLLWFLFLIQYQESFKINIRGDTRLSSQQFRNQYSLIGDDCFGMLPHPEIISTKFVSNLKSMMFQNMTVNHLAFAKVKLQNFFLVLRKVTGLRGTQHFNSSLIKPPPTIFWHVFFLWWVPSALKRYKSCLWWAVTPVKSCPVHPFIRFWTCCQH